MALAIAILAAGKGTRLKSARPKVLHAIGGKALLAHVIDAALKIVPPNDIFVVVGHGAEAVRAAVGSTGVHFVEQGEQKGTGHALQQALGALRDYEHVLVLSGDVPLLESRTIASLRDFHLRERAAMTILTAEVERPFGYGRIVRRGAAAGAVSNAVEVIVEQKELTPAQEAIREVNSGVYAFAIAHLGQHIDLIDARRTPTVRFI